MLVVRTFRVIPSGEYVLKMNFSGVLTGKITGFYLSTYVDLSHSVR